MIITQLLHSTYYDFKYNRHCRTTEVKYEADGTEYFARIPGHFSTYQTVFWLTQHRMAHIPR